MDVKYHELSPDEQTIIESTNEIFSSFYKQPTQEIYQKLFGNEIILSKHMGFKFYMFVIAASLKFNLEPKISDIQKIMEYKNICNRLLNPNSLLSAYDLDVLWILYFATGDECYSNRIKNIIADENQDYLVRMAACWSCGFNL